MDMNCSGLVRVVLSWLRMSSVVSDSFGWVVADSFGWLRMVSGGMGWFAVLVVTINSYQIHKQHIDSMLEFYYKRTPFL